ncbi:hypothetical protein FNF29_05248 [Cafeteria roenbergensis]|uniref:Uncharacterized protein n=1 Tax=Cafeteria roenbergensis TaxID=33653 RepID=A0A5A8CBZ2_CAFRO|nr:hypothetical protein FNF29_05248 [Cafeteria roenbergensis]|eukprot:KAA0150445.1 hypothetical protein FNF29_05248 [Cafeteria roenbergensis]
MLVQRYFQACNGLWAGDAPARARGLSLRTYRVVPVTRAAGVLEFVEGAVPLQQPITSMHERYRPHDAPQQEVVRRVRDAESEPVEGRVAVMKHIFSAMVRPALHWLFLERFPHPEAALQRRRAFSASLAAASAAGHVVGLGDRHLSNVMMVPSMGEVVHIDFGVSFEQAALLHTPELVPFRLTRDLTAAMGAGGVEAGFRQGLEASLASMRAAPSALGAVIGVVLDDPLCKWLADGRQRMLWQARMEEEERIRQLERERGRSVAGRSMSVAGSVLRAARGAEADEDAEAGAESAGSSEADEAAGPRYEAEEDGGSPPAERDTLAPEALAARRGAATAARLAAAAVANAGAFAGGEAEARARKALSRCQEKLQGHESLLQRDLDPAAQCRFLIEQATDMRHLAVLYRGWQAWM